MGCKRVVFSNDWYPALARPNVELVTDRIVRIVPDGVVTADGTARAGGRDHLRHRVQGGRVPRADAGVRPAAAGGCRRPGGTGPRPTSASRSPGSRTSSCSTGRTPTSAATRSSTCSKARSATCSAPSRRSRRERLAWLDVRPDVQDAFNAWVQTASRTSVWESGCHSWYTTASGRNTNNWPDHTFLYRYRVRRFDLAAYRVMPEPAAAVRPAGSRGMSARQRSRRRAAACRPRSCASGARQLGRRCLDPALPWQVQRTRLDQLTRTSLLPRGTTVAEQTIGGVPAEVVSASGRRRRAAADGDPLPRRRLLRGLGAHGPGVGGAPERPGGLPGRAARVPAGARASPSGGARGRPRGPGRAGRRRRAGLVVRVGRLGGRRASPWPCSCRCATRARSCPAGCILLSPWLDLGRDRRADPGPGAPGRAAQPGLARGLRPRVRRPGGLGRPVGLAAARRARRAAAAADPGRDQRAARPGRRAAGRQRLGRRGGRDLHQVAAHVARLRAAARPARRRRQRAGAGRLVRPAR